VAAPARSEEATVIVVSPAAPAHTDEAVRVLTHAFRADAVMSRMLGGPEQTRPERLAHLLRAIVRGGLRSGLIDLARAEGDPTVLGVAVWGTPRARAGAEPGHTLADLGCYLRAFGLTGLLRGSRIDGLMEAARPAEPPWYLKAIGVDAGGQGRGVGSALLEHRLRQVAGTAAYLEASTERSAALYARHGFTSLGPVPGFGRPAPISMWRPAVPALTAAGAR
jgi:ribosomal protein S18 acetylase RimI-like enzyme